jgi:hypothetical protein
MEASGTANAFSLRSEILSPLFSIIGGGESGYIICGPAMGKTRLIDQMKREDMQKQYWGEEHQPTLLVRVNSDLVSNWSDLGLYELILHALAMECGNQPALSVLQKEFTTWDTETILHHDELLALRLLQLATQKVCQTHRICFLLDELTRHTGVYRQKRSTVCVGFGMKTSTGLPFFSSSGSSLLSFAHQLNLRASMN